MTEVKTFVIADHEVDMLRCVIKKGQSETQVEPKVLKVLLLLARRQNDVVSHEEIMQQVWQGTEVVPNALQRCIAILRKAFGDDAKSPTVIATHPRIGYRLLADVIWPDSAPPSSQLGPQVEDREQADPTDRKKLALMLLSSLTLLLFLLLWRFWPDNTPVYRQVQPLTQTDAHESHAIYSPNGEFVVFNRYAGGCKSHLWAREQSTGKETQLTAEPGFYGDISFTPDGRELVFPAKVHCVEDLQGAAPSTNPLLCWNIATLDFALGLNAPQTPAFRHQCQADTLKHPKALGNHQYTFLQYNDGFYRLVHYDDLNNVVTTLYQADEEYIYHYDYAPKTKQFALISRDKSQNNKLTILNKQGALLHTAPIRSLAGDMPHGHITAHFEPQEQYLLAVSNKGLYKIHLDGQLEPVPTPQTNLISVTQHPATTELLAVTGHKDTDIAQLKMGESNQISYQGDLNQAVLPYPSLARSRVEDKNAQFQPQDRHIAFVSARSGQDQIWLWQQNSATQLSAEQGQTAIHHFSWSPDGQHLAWVDKGKLVISDLDGNRQKISADKALFSVLNWHTENQLLVLINDPFPGGLYLYDLDQNTLTGYGINQVDATWVYQQQLFYSTRQGKVFTRPLHGTSEPSRLLPALNGKAMVLTNDKIYSVSPGNPTLNVYNLDGELVETVMTLKGTAWKITDIRDNLLLLSQFIAINQEIVIIN